MKTHKGVHTEFQRLTKDDPQLKPELRSFLSRAYNLKAIADYETGPGSVSTGMQAKEALGAAKEFVAHLARVLEAPKSGTSSP